MCTYSILLLYSLSDQFDASAKFILPYKEHPFERMPRKSQRCKQKNYQYLSRELSFSTQL
jgi:hypothetical protein